MRIAKIQITNGLVSIDLERYEADTILEKLCDVIRQLSRLNPDPENYIKIGRIALICHQLSKLGSTISVNNLSKEDIEFIYNLNLYGPILNDLSGLRKVARSCNKLSMIEADRLAKDFEHILTC